jgi:putative membrane-bound dehydrogenase-like protein
MTPCPDFPRRSRREEARFLCLTVALALATPSSAAQFTLGAHTFTLPEGFTIEVAVPSSLVPRPIEADFDEQGRLYVTDSSGSNDNVRKQLADKPHRVLRLEDTDGDGVFDKSVVFADRMMFPEGAMWLDGSLYVSAPPSIWKLTDTNSDGVADVRVEWYQGKSLGGCANDLHGPYLGPDGWIYWCKGGFERQTNILGNGKTFVSRASHIWRARPDGTGLEPIMTGGMDNPVGLAWSPEGELFLSGTFFQHPGGGRRDGLIHVIYGGVYGKDHDVLEGHPRTGPDLMPIMTHLGPAAPVGLARYESAVFGREYQDNLFCALFNLHKVSRHVLKESGSTYSTTDSDFLVSDNPDFHPTDVFEDADGSLLVIDTGGWYKLCCPTSQLHKPDVLGAIYRIRRKGTPKVDDPRGLALNWKEAPVTNLMTKLEDPRPVVRNRAAATLVERKTGADSELGFYVLQHIHRNGSSVEARLAALWAFCRYNSAASLRELQVSAASGNPRLQMAAFRGWALAGFLGDTDSGQDWMRAASPLLRRTAVEAEGRSGLGSTRWLLGQASAANEQVFEHAVIHALITIAELKELLAGLTSTNEAVQRAAFIALDQLPGGHLKPGQVTPLLASTHAPLRQAAHWIVSRHPEWGGELAGYFQQRLAADLTDSDRAELERQLAQFAKHEAIQSLLAGAACGDNASATARRSALRAMARAGLKEMPAAWSSELTHSLEGPDPQLLPEVIAAARALPAPKSGAAELAAGLLRAASNAKLGAQVRLDALAAVPGGLAQVEAATFDFLLAHLDPAQSVAQRSAASGVLARARLGADQLAALLTALKAAGPLELPKLLGAFEKASDEALGLKLIAALGASKAAAALRPDTLKPRLTNFPARVQQRADELLASLNRDAAAQKARLESLLTECQGGDIRRGQAIFNSARAACSACHAIGYLGGNLGPDLTRIGQVRNERDLLEAIVFPSASFVRSYEPVLVVTKDGEEHSGVLRRDAPDEIVLGTGPGAELRLARSDVAELRPGAVSTMPGGLDEQLSRQELADLLAFLKATRW